MSKKTIVKKDNEFSQNPDILTVKVGNKYDVIDISLPKNFFEQIITNEVELSEEFKYEKLNTLVQLYLSAIQYYSSFDPKKVKAYQNRLEYLLTQKDTLKNLCKLKSESVENVESVKVSKSSNQIRGRAKTKFKIESKVIKKEEIKNKVNQVLIENTNINETKKNVKILIKNEFENQNKNWKEKLAKKKKGLRNSIRTSIKKSFYTPGPAVRNTLNIGNNNIEINKFEISGKNMPKYGNIDDEDSDNDNKSETMDDDFLKMFKEKHKDENKKDSDEDSIINDYYNDEDDFLVKIVEVGEEHIKKSEKDVINKINDIKIEDGKEKKENKMPIKGILKKKEKPEKKEEKEDEVKEENKENIVEKQEEIKDKINEDIEKKDKADEKKEKSNEKKDQDKNEKKEENKNEIIEEKSVEKIEDNKDEKKEEKNKVIKNNEEKDIKQEENNAESKPKEKKEKKVENNIKNNNKEDSKEDNDTLAAKDNKENKEDFDFAKKRPLERKKSIVDEDVTRKIELDQDIRNIIEEKMKMLENLKEENDSGEDSNLPSSTNLPTVTKKINIEEIPPIFQETFLTVEEKMKEYINTLNNHFYKDAFEEFSSKLKELYDSKYEKYIKVNNEYHSSITEKEYLLENEENLNDEKKLEIQNIIDSLKEEQKDQIDKIVDEYNNNIKLLINEFKQNSFKKNTSIQLLEEQLKLEIYTMINEAFY